MLFNTWKIHFQNDYYVFRLSARKDCPILGSGERWHQNCCIWIHQRFFFAMHSKHKWTEYLWFFISAFMLIQHRRQQRPTETSQIRFDTHTYSKGNEENKLLMRKIGARSTLHASHFNYLCDEIENWKNACKTWNAFVSRIFFLHWQCPPPHVSSIQLHTEWHQRTQHRKKMNERTDIGLENPERVYSSGTGWEEK